MQITQRKAYEPMLFTELGFTPVLSSVQRLLNLIFLLLRIENPPNVIIGTELYGYHNFG